MRIDPSPSSHRRIVTGSRVQCGRAWAAQARADTSVNVYPDAVSSSPNRSTVTIVCALEFERAILRRSELGDRCEIACSGPGARGIHAWGSHANPQGPVILAGLAGALRPGIPAGSAWCIREVIVPDGPSKLIPALNFDQAPFAAVTSTSRAVTTPLARQQLHQQTGADLVDLESIAFAQVAVERNWEWAIVRAVSDDCSMTLPADIDTWIDESGTTRIGAVMRSALRSPRIIPTLRHLRRSSRAAMTSLTQTLHQVLDAAPIGNSG